MSDRQRRRHYGLTLVQILTPFLVLGAVALAGLLLTTRWVAGV
ncbi:MAG TPA: hypothetical protein VGI30_05260 [Caulobacteraceae bacterium]